MPAPGEQVDEERAALFNRLAALTRQPDAAFTELRRLCRDDRLRVPATVHNDVRDRDEAVRGLSRE